MDEWSMVEWSLAIVTSLAFGIIGMKVWENKGGESVKGFLFSLTWFGFIYVLFVTPPVRRVPRGRSIQIGDVLVLRRTFRSGLTLLHKGERVRVVGRTKTRGPLLVQPVDRELKRPAQAWPQELGLAEDPSEVESLDGADS